LRLGQTSYWSTLVGQRISMPLVSERGPAAGHRRITQKHPANVRRYFHGEHFDCAPLENVDCLPL